MKAGTTIGSVLVALFGLGFAGTAGAAGSGAVMSKAVTPEVCTTAFERINDRGGMLDDDNDSISVSEAASWNFPEGAFEKLDTDDSMSISRQEFSQCADARQAMMAADWDIIVFVAGDGDMSRRTDVSSAENCGYRFQMLNRGVGDTDDHLDVTEGTRLDDGQFQAMDANDDSMVMRDEFVEHCRTTAG